MELMSRDLVRKEENKARAGLRSVSLLGVCGPGQRGGRNYPAGHPGYVSRGRGGGAARANPG